MKWQGRERSSNIEDRRSQGGFGGGMGGGFGSPMGRGGGMRIPIGGKGGLGIGSLIVIGIICLVLGVNPLDVLSGGGSTSTVPYDQTTTSSPVTPAEQDEMANFVGVVVKENENMWGQYFKQHGQSYTPPKVVLFTAQTNTGCGTATAETGPFYCPEDQKVYIDLSFYNQLRDQFGAPGDFAQAYVLAHEVGHHIQNVTGTLGEFNRARQSMSPDQANAYSVRVELQADCYAGVWANFAGRENILDNGDVQEAVNAAQQIGDDTLQREMQGRVVPRTFTHGTSEQRAHWFEVGQQSGDPDSCNTFSGNI